MSTPVSRRAVLSAAVLGGGGLLALAGLDLLAEQADLGQLGQQELAALGPLCGLGGDETPSAAALHDIPPDYLAFYQAAPAGNCPGLSWSVLAGIGKVETNHGRGWAPNWTATPGIARGTENFAGAGGPMQFLAGTWAIYGRGGDRWDPHDAIPAAARLLAANGAPADLGRAIFAYNHADWYVQDVLKQAAAYTTAGQPPASCAATPLPPGVAGQVIAFALAQIGKPYIFGASGPDAFDCSGLTMAAYGAAGLRIPRVAADQWAALPHVDPRVPPGVQPADLIYFDVDPTRPGVDHCGVVYDPAHKQMIVARHPGTNVQIQSYAGLPTVGYARPKAA